MKPKFGKPILVLTALAIALGSVAFFVARNATSGDDAKAENPGGLPPAAVGTPRDPFWYRSLLDDDLKKPRTPKVVNGMTLGPNVPQVGSPCTGTPRAGDGPVALDQTKGDELQVEPAFLPAGTVFEFGKAGTCGGVIANVEKTFSVPADPQTDRFGGSLSIYRFRGAPSFPLPEADERVTPGSIKGRPAAVARPLTDSGFGSSAVIVREPYGLTVIRASGLRLGDVIRVAESLY